MRDFSHLNEGKFSRLKFWGLTVLSFMFLGGGIAFFVFYFEVETITLEKDETDANLRYGEILQMMEFVKKKNILILSGDFLEKQILIRFPELEVISVQKKFPKTLLITAKTDPVVVKLIYSIEENTDQYYGFLSEKGVFFRNGNEEVFHLFLTDKRTSFISPLEKVLSESEISEILKAKNLLEEVTVRKIVSAELLKKAQEIHFLDDQGVKYWIFLKNDISPQLEKLRLVLMEKNIYETPISYIDLRISRKVIYLPL